MVAERRPKLAQSRPRAQSKGLQSCVSRKRMQTEFRRGTAERRASSKQDLIGSVAARRMR